MSSFSRGVFPRHQLPCAIRLLNTCLPHSTCNSRFFSSTILQQAVTKPRKTSIPELVTSTYAKAANKPAFQDVRPSPLPKHIPQSAPPTYSKLFADSLASKGRPTIIYQAPSHFALIFCSYSGALFCFGYAAFSFWSNTLYPPPDLAKWVPIAYGGISFMMACFGGWLILSPTRLIKSITAIPTKGLQSNFGATKGHAKAAKALTRQISNPTKPDLILEVELRKRFLLPFMPKRHISAPPSEFSLSSPLDPVSPTLTREQLLDAEMRAKAERQKVIDYDKAHIWSTPFREISRGLYSLFKGVGRSWTREGFLKLEHKGHNYKLDATGGWALEGGRALDKLIGTAKRTGPGLKRRVLESVSPLRRES
jgi:hypothetical protein